MDSTPSPAIRPDPLGQPRARRYELVVAGVLMLAAVLYFGAAAFGAYLDQRRASTAFVPVAATVVQSSVQSRGSPAAGGGTTFRPHIVYRYVVQARPYQAERYFYSGDGWRDAAEAQAVVAEFPAGSAVRAYVDPRDPTRAVLDRTPPAPGMLLYLVPLLLIGVAAVFFGLRRRASAIRP